MQKKCGFLTYSKYPAVSVLFLLGSVNIWNRGGYRWGTRVCEDGGLLCLWVADILVDGGGVLAADEMHVDRTETITGKRDTRAEKESRESYSVIYIRTIFHPQSSAPQAKSSGRRERGRLPLVIVCHRLKIRSLWCLEAKGLSKDMPLDLFVRSSRKKNPAFPSPYPAGLSYHVNACLLAVLVCLRTSNCRTFLAKTRPSVHPMRVYSRGGTCPIAHHDTPTYIAPTHLLVSKGGG